MRKFFFAIIAMCFLAGQQETKIEDLIDKLQKVTEQGIGYHSTLRGSQFLPVAGSKGINSGILGSMNHKPSRTLEEIVSRGSKAIPILLRHLDDKRETEIPPLYPMMWRKFSAEYDWNSKNCKIASNKLDEQRKPEQLIRPIGYTVTVGDLCFVALGQIVNRNFQATRYQATGGLIINSPSHTSYLCEIAREEWGNLSPEQHKNSLVQDFLFPDWENRRIGAYVRLAYYYPDVVEPLVLEVLSKQENVQEGFIEALALNSNEKIDKAIYEILLKTNDDSLAIACMGKLIGCGYDQQIKGYINKKWEKVASNSELLKIQEKLGRTRLHNMVEYQNFNEIKYLLKQQNTELNVVGNDGKSALHIAAELGNMKIIKLLLEHKVRLDIRDKQGWTPVQYAAHKFYREAVLLLVQSGCEIPDILVASFAGDIIKVSYFLEQGITSHSNEDLLHIAAWIGNEELILLFLKNGWDVNIKDSSNLTPLHIVTNQKAAKILLEYGANIHVEGQGFSPLHFAVLNQRLDVAEVLINHGAETHSKDKHWNKSPLMWTAYRRDVKGMKFLLKYRKITEVWYQDTQDALNIAKYNDDDNMIDLLKSSEIIDIENTIVK